METGCPPPACAIQFVFADHLDKLKPFVDRLTELDYGDATTSKKLASIVDNQVEAHQLALQLAAMNEM